MIRPPQQSLDVPEWVNVKRAKTAEIRKATPMEPRVTFDVVELEDMTYKTRNAQDPDRARLQIRLSLKSPFYLVDIFMKNSHKMNSVH